jgi:hypothetical protein
MAFFRTTDLTHRPPKTRPIHLGPLGCPPIADHDRLRASLKPIITKGPFSLIWINPRPPGDDDDEQD